MNDTPVSLDVLGTAVFALLAVFLVITGFNLPKNFFEKQKKRAEIRQRLLEKEYREKLEERPAHGAAKAEAEKTGEPSGEKKSGEPGVNPKKS